MTNAMKTEAASKAKKIDTRFHVHCQECGKKWKTHATMPVCPKCNSVDIEPVEARS